ncbi:unnamed protein product [Auanema sp. JU1783]|nr:unnamed protein product [Auanema sp. JU1783]
MLEAELPSSLINDKTRTTTSSSSNAFDMDENAWIRAIVVVVGLLILTGLYCGVQCYRRANASRSRIRKYDIVSTRELQTGLAIDSDSDDDIFGPTSDRQKLFSKENS